MTEEEQIKEDWEKLIGNFDMNFLIKRVMQAQKDNEKYGGCFEYQPPHPDK